MAKSARAKKAKKADFAKVKLKVGKKLKKAQNETRTDFKTRKIIVKEQLAKKEDETLITKKKHNIKELLSRLNHTNTYVRQDGVTGLLELVKSNNCDMLLPHLSLMVAGAAPCIFDSDTSIRATTLKLIEALIIKVGVHMEPYLNVVATHLSCAMVHLNMHIQGDSLKLMNVLVTRCPALIARHASTLLKNFINLISRKVNANGINDMKKSSSMVDFTRVLQDSPGNTMTAHKWRLRLLHELSAFMEAVLTEQTRIEYHLPLTTWQTVVSGSVAPVLTCEGHQGSADLQVSLFTDPTQLEEFVNSIVPLLFQIWAEIEPSTKEHSQGSNMLSEEAIETLSCILSIITQLWRTAQTLTKQTSIQCNGFFGQLKYKYKSKIMRWFPCYCHIPAARMQKKKNRKVGSEEYGLRYCDDLNMSMAAIAIQFSPSQDFYQNAANFLAKLLRDGTRDGQYRLANLVDVMLVLLTPTTTQNQSAPPLPPDSLLDGAFTCYTRLHPLKRDRPQLLRILLAATNHDNMHLWQCESVKAWIRKLVNELMAGEVTREVVEAAIILGLRGNEVFKENLSPCKDQIRENLRTRSVQGWSKDQVNLKLEYLIKD